LFSENWMAKYGWSFLQDSWAPSELESFVPGGQERSPGNFSEGLEDGGKDGCLAPRHPQKHEAKFFRSMRSRNPEDVSQVSEKLFWMKPRSLPGVGF
jgi:hypothetical protein